MRQSINQVTETLFRDVLLDPYAFPADLALYLREGKEWDLDQQAMITDPNLEEDEDSTVGQRIANEKWQYILEVSIVQSIMDYLSEVSPTPALDMRLKSFVYYFEHDAFAELVDLA